MFIVNNLIYLNIDVSKIKSACGIDVVSPLETKFSFANKTRVDLVLQSG